MKQIVRLNLINSKYLGDILKDLDQNGGLLPGVELEVLLSHTLDMKEVRVETRSGEVEGSILDEGVTYTIKKKKEL